jgi:hypothetical protein
MADLLSYIQFLLLLMAVIGLGQAIWRSLRPSIDPQGFAQDALAKSDRSIATGELKMPEVAAKAEKERLESIDEQRARRRAKQ